MDEAMRPVLQTMQVIERGLSVVPHLSAAPFDQFL